VPRTSKKPGIVGGDLSAALRLVEKLQPALQRDERATIVDLVRQLVALRAPMARQWLTIAQIMADNGENGLACEAADLYVEYSGGSSVARYHKAALFTNMGAWAKARAVIESLPQDAPDPATNTLARGMAALYLGEADEARRQLERATLLRPQAGLAWVSLGALVDFALEPALADRLIAAESSLENAARSERASYFHSLGKMWDDRGEHERAFAAYTRGATEARHEAVYDRQRDRVIATNAVQGYDADRIAGIARQQTERTAQTIFVVGLPRSGTTLVEQILTSHSAVGGGAETTRLSLFAKDIRGLSCADLERYVGELGAPAAARLWNHWMQERFGTTARVVDKTTNTSRMLGLAAALLPEAPLIWVTREPMDRAWSCFRTYFGPSQPWSNDLADIGYHFRLEDGLLAQWQQILGERLLVVPYEELVTEPEAWTRRLLAHCDLAEEPQVFSPHRNPRPVSTASMMQVRRPINSRAVGASEPYRAFLEPFGEAYSN